MRSGGVLCLPNGGQLELLRATIERGASLRTRVRGWSMYPFIRDLDVVVISPPGPAPVRVGQVIAFAYHGSSRMAVHRVVTRDHGGWLVRGDNCDQPDGIVAFDAIVGYVVSVERQGKKIRLGMGPEARMIAWLSRRGALQRMVALAGKLRSLVSRSKSSDVITDEFEDEEI